MALFRRKRKLSEDTMQDGVKLVTAIEPKNVVSEQFRTVRTNIDFSSVDKQLKTLLFTSSGVSEGKSTVSANTAVAWAQQGKKYFLFDADLRRPTLHSTFGLLNSQGLSTILANDTNFHDVAVETAIENLTVITSGPVPPNPAELLNSNRMKSLLKSVESEYDLDLLNLEQWVCGKREEEVK